MQKVRFVRDKALYAWLNLVDLVDLVFFRIIYVFLKKEKSTKKVWLFAERGNDARDNAFFMFEYVNKNYPEIESYYVISESEKNSIDYKKVKKVGRVLHRKSFEHKKKFMQAQMLISAHFRGSIEPWRERLMKIFYKDYYKKKFVFLQHGITYNDISHFVSKDASRFDLFFAGAFPEYKYLLKTLGYSEKEIKYTGFARYDFLHDFKVKDQILFMPTWRRFLVTDKFYHKEENFKKTSYYKNLNSLINDDYLAELLEKNNLKFVFFIHAEMQRFAKFFNSKHRNVIIARKDSFDVQILLKESKLLITDYSSVMFDFSYMKKPLINFTFDTKDFTKHLKKGYFSVEKDSFGSVCKNTKEVVDEIEKNIKRNFVLTRQATERIDKFFVLHDTDNRKRIIKEILNLEK